MVGDRQSMSLEYASPLKFSFDSRCRRLCSLLSGKVFRHVNGADTLSRTKEY
jgi:hypothetical protein